MAQIFRIAATGKKQGQFKGGSTRKGWENTTELHGFEYLATNAADANRGTYGSNRRHEPVVVVGQIDKATPQYWIALTTTETLTTVKIDFFRPSPDGKITNFYTIQLTNAAVVGVRHFTEKESTHAEEHDILEQVEIKFAFQKIDVTWIDGGITGTDDWNTPVS
jgi:type VI secretion system secreted protein Hcp